VLLTSAEVPTADRNGSKMFFRWAAGVALVVAGIVCSATGASAHAGGHAVGAAAVPTVSLTPISPASAAPPVARTSGHSHRDAAPALATTVPALEREVAGPAVITPGGLWSGGPLQGATILSLPMALGVLLIGFIVLQWLVDRRDPKLVEAPARKDDDSLGFE
jgi:hypothetical protein